jgi:hypoxanthine phosphoribosyltransferase
MKRITILDKEFEISYPSEIIQQAITRVAQQINKDLKGKEVVFLGILNGSFMFAADLFKQIDFPCQITFLKLASYEGTSTTGKVKKLIGINENLKGKTVVVVEDIIDTGNTIVNIINQITEYQPEKVVISTLLMKPEVYTKDIKIDYIGMEIPNHFIVGYGLDYDGFGRNLPDIYTVVH